MINKIFVVMERILMYLKTRYGEDGDKCRYCGGAVGIDDQVQHGYRRRGAGGGKLRHARCIERF